MADAAHIHLNGCGKNIALVVEGPWKAWEKCSKCFRCDSSDLSKHSHQAEGFLKIF